MSLANRVQVVARARTACARRFGNGDEVGTLRSVHGREADFPKSRRISWTRPSRTGGTGVQSHVATAAVRRYTQERTPRWCSPARLVASGVLSSRPHPVSTERSVSMIGAQHRLGLTQVKV